MAEPYGADDIPAGFVNGLLAFYALLLGITLGLVINFLVYTFWNAIPAFFWDILRVPNSFSLGSSRVFAVRSFSGRVSGNIKGSSLWGALSFLHSLCFYRICV